MTEYDTIIKLWGQVFEIHFEDSDIQLIWHRFLKA